MATLPDANALGERPVPQGGQGVATFEPPNWRQVGMVGQTVQQSGRDLEEASNIVTAATERQDESVAQNAVNALTQARTNLEFDPNAGFRNLKEGQVVAPDFQKDWTQKFTDAQSAIGDTLSNPNQKRIFQQHAGVVANQYQSSLLQHQAQETDRFNDTTDNNTVQLALRDMAARPQDELGFQTNLLRINGTIDAMGQRKGLPSTVTDELKTKTLDAAYTTRILSTLNGIPGVAPANPYQAEAMFKQVQPNLGPASQVTLAHEVQRGVQQVQARDTAQSLVFGGPQTTPPSTLAPVAGKPLQAVVESLESGGRDTNASGQPLTSSAGAQGRMQVMPATAANPGYGVAPARDDSPDELARVGHDYLGAMSARYQDPALTLAAYNAGPGQVDKWIQQIGDPRTGAISSSAWASKIPFAETQKYVTDGLHKLNADAGNPGAPIAAPTANNLKTDLYARVMQARQIAEQQYPGDAAYADSVASRVENYGRTVIANQQGVQLAAHDQLMAGVIGSKPDGSDAPISIDQLLSDPQQQANWDKATPEVKQAIQDRFARGNRYQSSDPKVVNDLTQRIYLPDGDPRKVTDPGQLYDYMAHGLNFTDFQHLRTELKEYTADGNPFSKQTALVKDTARKMLVGNPAAGTNIDAANEAAYQFGFDLDNKIKAYRTAGKDPSSLFTPTAPDYVLSPARVNAFMPTEAQIVARQAAGPLPGSLSATTAASGVVPRLPGETPAAYLARVGK